MLLQKFLIEMKIRNKKRAQIKQESYQPHVFPQYSCCICIYHHAAYEAQEILPGGSMAPLTGILSILSLA